MLRTVVLALLASQAVQGRHQAPVRFGRERRQNLPVVGVPSAPAADSAVESSTSSAVLTIPSSTTTTADPVVTPTIVSTSSTTTTTVTPVSTTSSIPSVSSSSSRSSSTTTSASTTTAPLSSASTISSVLSTTSASVSIIVPSVAIVTVTSLSINSDGSTSTVTSQSASALPSLAASSSKSSGNGKTWGIVGGVVGGIVLLAALGYVIWRCTQDRFGDLDHTQDIKWPELAPDGQDVSSGLSTLNPLKARRTGGAGIGDEDEDEWDEKPSMSRGDSGNVSGMGHGGSEHFDHYQSHEQHYDSYLGASAAPLPAPSAIYPPPSAVHRSPSGHSPYLHHSPSSGSLVQSSSTNLFQPSASTGSFERLPSPAPRMPAPNDRPMSHYSYGQGIERGGSPMYGAQGIQRVGSPFHDQNGRVHSPRRGM